MKHWVLRSMLGFLPDVGPGLGLLDAIAARDDLGRHEHECHANGNEEEQSGHTDGERAVLHHLMRCEQIVHHSQRGRAHDLSRNRYDGDEEFAHLHSPPFFAD